MATNFHLHLKALIHFKDHLVLKCPHAQPRPPWISPMAGHYLTCLPLSERVSKKLIAKHFILLKLEGSFGLFVTINC